MWHGRHPWAENTLTRRALLRAACAGVSTASAAFAAKATVKPPERAVLRVPFWSDPVDAKIPAPTAFSAQVNGKPAKAIRALTADSELLLITVLDLAGDLSVVDPARHALVEKIESLPPKTLPGLLRAQDGLRVLSDPGTPRAQIATQIQGLTISGRAGLLDTVETALHLCDSILSRAFVRAAVLYVTDSLVSNYREDFTNPVVNSSDARDMSRRFPEALIKEKMQQLNTRVLSTQSPLFIVHLNHQGDRIGEAYQTGLLEMATLTGGTAEFCRTQTDIPLAISRAMDAVQSHRTVEIEFKTAREKEWIASLTVEGTPLRHRTRFLSPRR